MSAAQPAQPTIFRVHREKVAGKTVRIMLEPYRGDQVADLTQGDEFITGTLNSDPWAADPDDRAARTSWDS